jgi:hypothetical protein
MDCGSNEPVCLFFDWLSRHPHTIRQALESLDGLWNEAGGQLIKFLKEHGEKLIAIASFSFGVYRWWIYRERILHKRLEEYIRESDARLAPASAQTVEAILRPGRTTLLPQPAFAIELQEILARNRWLPAVSFFSVERHAERKLSGALRGIRKRQQIARSALQSLLEQQTQVHFLAGAIATSRARRQSDRSRAWRDDHAALREFRTVLQFPTHNHDAAAKECEALQLLRLGKRPEAFEAYENLEELAGALPDQRHRDLTVARAKRFQAQILQADAGEAGAGNAWHLIANSNNPDCAVHLRSRYSDFMEWEAIEEAETHFVAAWVACRLNFGARQASHLATAETVYGDVLAHLPKRSWFVPFAKKRLREEARAALKRIERAKTGDYDKDWLLV